MTADADASTRAARRGRSPFELLRFTATPVPGALVVVEIEGRVAAASGRFGRRPVLVVEPGKDRPRLELAPARSTLDGDRWQAAYAIPAEAYDAARFALGLRGTLLDLPAPDEPPAADRQTLLAREANALRRRLEAAEAAAEAARAEAVAAAGELGAAVSAARDEALAESAERIGDLEREVVEAHRLSASDAAELRAAHESALAEARTAHEALVAEKDQALRDAETRHEAALAEVRAEHEAALAEKDQVLQEESEAHDAEVARLRAGEDQGEQRRAAEAQARAVAAEEGIGVLREELAEERERSQARIAELEQELVAVTSRLETLRRAAEAQPRTQRPATGLWAQATPDADTDTDTDIDDATEDETQVLRQTSNDDPDRTQILSAVPAEDLDDDETRSFTAHEEREATGERVLPLERGALPRSGGGRGPGAWVAVAALVGFVIVLVVLLGFLG